MPRALPCRAGAREIEPLERPVFLADIHMGPGKPGIVRRFLKFLENEGRDYAELFILGDIFEFWIGDDTGWLAWPVSRALRRYASRGHRVFLMQGNRDVVMGEEFAESCGGRLLAGPIAVECRGRRIMLAHGDEWCTLDGDYQEVRAMLRDPAWQERALDLSVPRRIAMALGARRKSTAKKTAKTPEMMDVVRSAVAADAVRLNCGAVIHGHTHRPAAHTDENPPRWVVPNWEVRRGCRQEGWIELDDAGLPRLVLRREGVPRPC